jgi:hypothetical protein
MALVLGLCGRLRQGDAAARRSLTGDEGRDTAVADRK